MVWLRLRVLRWPPLPGHEPEAAKKLEGEGKPTRKKWRYSWVRTEDVLELAEETGAKLEELLDARCYERMAGRLARMEVEDITRPEDVEEDQKTGRGSFEFY